MIERGHQHRFYPVSVTPLDGGKKVHSRCNSQPPTADNPTPCMMEQELTFGGGRCVKVRYRVHGVWFHPYDLIRGLASIGVQECQGCGGEDLLEPCGKCGGLGVEGTDGLPVAEPDLRVARA